MKRAAACGRGEPGERDHAAKLISVTDKPELRSGQIVDRYGHVHSEAVFKNWSPAAIEALGIHRLKVKP